MTVYITQEVRGRDLTDAIQFGDLQVLVPAKEQIAYSTQPTVRSIAKGLQKYNDDDFKLFTKSCCLTINILYVSFIYILCLFLYISNIFFILVIKNYHM